MTRLAFKYDADASVRRTAVSGAKSDAIRLTFKDDADASVRRTAVRGAKSDATRLAFMDDDDAYVREGAVSGVRSITILQLALEREKVQGLRRIIQRRIKTVERNQAAARLLQKRKRDGVLT